MPCDKVNSTVMAESLKFSQAADRKTIYDEIVPQIDSLISGEADLIANLANVSAVIKQAFGFFWVGFYLRKAGELVLGPFQGPLACTRIKFTDGVCGHVYTTRQTLIVPNVEDFPGHIACAADSKSEIVVPIFGPSGEVVAVFDVDSDRLEDFSAVDAKGLEKIARMIENTLKPND